MKRFLDRITPSFIHRINDRLLKNDVLGWQLQLPLIIWLGLLIGLFMIPLPFLYSLDISGNSDKIGIISIGVIIAVLEFFLFGYILIQFNATKIFGKKTFARGLKEQFAYLLVMLLCLIYVIFAPLILDFRKSGYMTEGKIQEEAIVYNKARHYFMDGLNDYKYFPNDSAFNYFMGSFPTEQYRNRTEYYIEVIKPMLTPYFTQDSSMDYIDLQYERSEKVPQLYYIEDEYIKEDYSYKKDDSFFMQPRKKLYEYQLLEKTDEERLGDIKNFIALYKKYENKEHFHYREKLDFETPESILQKYQSNQYSRTINPIDADDKYPNASFLEDDIIEEVHSTVIDSKYDKWEDTWTRAVVCFHFAFVFALLIFVFKNVRLREFILTFVYSGLLVLVISIVSGVTGANEILPLHTLILLLFTGLFFAFTINNWNYFSHKKTILVILSNIFFAYVPIFFFWYFHEYLDWWKHTQEFCESFPIECREHDEMISSIRWICLWAGQGLYVLVGSLFYKTVYEKVFALPLPK